MTEVTAKGLARHIKIQPSGCWEWMGYIDPMGYGRYSVSKSTLRAHAAMYTFAVDDIPAGHNHHIHHLCENRRCCNPSHLVVTSRQLHNTLTARSRFKRSLAVHKVHDPKVFCAAAVWQKQKTHCARGHEFSPENTTIYNHNGSIWRQCKTCRRLNQRKKPIQLAA